MEKYQCRCGYVYDPKEGDATQGIAPGTPFSELPETWVCPLCGLPKANFVKVETGFITVKVKCFSTLVRPEACDYKQSTEHRIPERSTVRDLINQLNLPLDAIKIIFVNNREVDPNTVLEDGDQVGFSPVTGAM
jgi:rubredoxin/molybdopterin converting factor small subunit